MLLGTADLWFSILAGAALVAAASALFMLVSGRRAARPRPGVSQPGDERLDLLHASRDLIFTASPEGRILFANRALCDALKLSPSDLASQTLGDLVHPHTRTSVQAALEDAFTTGRSVAIEMVLTAPGGHAILVEGALQAYAGGASPAALGVFHDMTEQRGAESALRESEERFRAMIENSSDGIALHHADGTVFYAGPSTEKIVGYRPDELVGRNGFDFVHPDDLAFVRANFNRRLETPGATARAEYRYPHKDGTWRWIEAIGSNHLHRPGLGAIVVNFRDISDRKTAEEEMRRALSLLAAAIESTADGLLVVSPEGRIVTRNRRFAEMWGIPEDVLRSGEDEKALAVAVNQLEDPDAFLAKVRELYGNPEAESYDVLTLRDGRVFERYSRPQRIDGKPVGRVWSFRDVTERIRAEAEVRRATSSLEQRVAERTSELEGVNKELEAFSYTVSHDLRTPLRAIDGFSRVLLEDEAERLGPEARRILQTIRRNTQSMSTLIDDLLAFSRLGRTPLRAVMIDMGALARAIFEELRLGQPETRIRLVTGDLPPARGDRAMIRQVVANLLSNALKFTMRRPEAIIEIGGRASGDENVYFVKDNGAGFDPRFADKLFGVFQRLHSLSEFEGTGVGLAIVARIIQRHGGRVWAEGEPDRGATFYFTLPARPRKQTTGTPAQG